MFGRFLNISKAFMPLYLTQEHLKYCLTPSEVDTKPGYPMKVSFFFFFFLSKGYLTNYLEIPFFQLTNPWNQQNVNVRRYNFEIVKTCFSLLFVHFNEMQISRWLRFIKWFSGNSPSLNNY